MELVVCLLVLYVVKTESCVFSRASANVRVRASVRVRALNGKDYHLFLPRACVCVCVFRGETCLCV